METRSILTYFFCYVMFFVLSWISKVNNTQRLINDEGGLTSKPADLLGSHIMGIFWLGAVPVILLKDPLLKVLTGNKMPESFYVLLFVLVFILIMTIAFKQSESAFGKKQGSQGISLSLSPAFFVRYFITRSLFLFVYELWFRGFLLFDSIAWAGIPAAIALNVFLYVLVHIFNSRKEMLACIPFGLMVCSFSIVFNAVWPAIILHISFSLVYEFNIYRSYFFTSQMIRQ